MADAASGLLLALFVVLPGCSRAPVAEVRREDPVSDARYVQTEQTLRTLNTEAARLMDAGNLAGASTVVKQAEPHAQRLLAVSRPPLAAMEAVSDFDDLYGRTLLKSRNYVWARTVFQKNVARWKNWRPQTTETARRLKQASDAVAECDRQQPTR